MKRSMVVCAILSMLAQTVPAATRADSLLAFTGNRHVKAVWTRDAWCEANYTPIASHAGYHKLQVVVYSTTETSGPRVINPESDGVAHPLITRKDASQVVWTDEINKCAWIRNFSGSGDKRNLNLGTDYRVLSVDHTTATGAENLYVISVDLKTIYRIPLTSAYAADLSRKTAVITGSVQIDETFSVSGDGKMAGCALPWPDTYIYNMETKQANFRHTGQFGCNCNIAPDNSYRFFHFGDDHDLIHVFAADLVNSFTDIATTGVPLGNNAIGQGCPRFTSNVNYMTVTSPNHTDDPDTWDMGADEQFGWSAAKVQQCPLYMFGAFYLGKFGADFKSLTWCLISGGDRRVNDGLAGMAWVAPNPGPLAGVVDHAAGGGVNAMQALVTVHDGLVEAHFPAGVPGAITLVTTAGRTVSQASGSGRVVCAMGSGLKGALIARVTSGAEVSTMRVMVR